MATRILKKNLDKNPVTELSLSDCAGRHEQGASGLGSLRDFLGSFKAAFKGSSKGSLFRV